MGYFTSVQGLAMVMEMGVLVLLAFETIVFTQLRIQWNLHSTIIMDTLE